MAVQPKNRTRAIALVSSFAALYAALRFIPFSIVIGTPGAFFSFSDFLPLLYAIMLGPSIGVLSVSLGTYVALSLGRPPVFPEFIFFEFVPAVVNVLIVGFLTRGRRVLSLVIFLLFLSLFVLHPFTLNLVSFSIAGINGSVPFYWLHLVAIILLASPLASRSVRLFWDARSVNLLGISLLFAFIGTMGQHIAGGLLTEISKGNIAGVFDAARFRVLWTAVFVAYPFERSIITIASGILATAVMRSLRLSIISQHRKHPFAPER